LPDITCALCGEPWDNWTVVNEWLPDQAKKLKTGRGCPCCGFGTLCPECNGSGRWQTGCPDCFGHGYVHAWRNASFDNGRWQFGKGRHVKRCEPFTKIRSEPGEMSREGYVEVALAVCPTCGCEAHLCPRCEGSGKFRPVFGTDGLAESALASVLEASDEEPVGIITAFMAAQEARGDA
jgi:hypothetical protein